MGVMTHDVDVDAMAKDQYRYDAALRESQLRQAVEFAQSWHGRTDGRIRAMVRIKSIPRCGNSFETSGMGMPRGASPPPPNDLET